MTPDDSLLFNKLNRLLLLTPLLKHSSSVSMRPIEALFELELDQILFNTGYVATQAQRVPLSTVNTESVG